MKLAYFFDLDGTLADLTHRLHYIDRDKGKPDWAAFFTACGKDEPIAPICQLFGDLSSECASKIILSGRSDEVRDLTERWLEAAGLVPDLLVMRKAGDHRSDDIVKSEMLDKLLADGWFPILFVDDRKRVVDMWRRRGYTCLQCAEGEF